MSNMLTRFDVAGIVGQNLNDIANLLYEQGEISDKIVFNVTSDEQTYIRMQRAEYEIGDYQYFTPVIIYRKSFYQYPADYLRYQESYDIKIYGYQSQINSLEKIFKYYTNLENTENKSILLDGFRVTKETNDMDFGEPIEPKDGSLEKRVIGEGSFTWTFLDGVMTSYDIAIEIDGVEIPYIQYSFASSNRQIANKQLDTIGYSNLKSANTFGISLLIPYIKTSDKIVELYNELYNKTYNKKHTLTYMDSAGVSYTYDVVMQDKSFNDTRVSVLEFNITFVRAEEKITLKINDTEVPVLTYGSSSEAQLVSSQNIQEDFLKSTVMGSNYVITMDLDISDYTNPITEELLEKVLKQDFNTPYRITLTKRNITVDYDVILKSGSYSFDENPDDRISLTFVRIDEDLISIG